LTRSNEHAQVMAAKPGGPCAPKNMLKETVRRFLPRQLKEHRIRRGPLAGRRIYTSWHDYPGAIRGDTESPLLEWFARNVKSGETWLDIGAHYGYTAIALARLVGQRGRVIAFEPVLSTAGCIARTREANGLSQLQIVPLGLSSSPGLVPCRLPVWRGMADQTALSRDWEELLFMTGFDGFWESLGEGNLGGMKIDGVKIDVQGMEGEVLSGMIGTLLRWHPKLVVEFHSGVEREIILDLLEDCGYHRKPVAIESPANGIEDDKSYAFISKS